MMREVVFFHLSHVLGEFRVMEATDSINNQGWYLGSKEQYLRIMHAVISDVWKNKINVENVMQAMLNSYKR